MKDLGVQYRLLSVNFIRLLEIFLNDLRMSLHSDWITMNILYRSLLLACLFSRIQSAKILGIYLVGRRSTFMFEQETVKVLLNRGHEVHVISKFVQNPKILNYTDIDVSEDIVGFDGTISVDDFDDSIWNTVQFAFKTTKGNCERLFRNKKIQNLVSSQRYDLVIVELDGTECILPLAFSFGAPVVGIYTDLLPFPDTNWLLGNPVNPAYLPSSLIGYSTKMTFLERVNNVFGYVAHFVLRIWHGIDDTRRARQVFPDSASILELMNNVSLVVCNNFLGFVPRAFPPHTISVSGIHIKEVAPLPKDVKNFIDGFENGVIYVSFGSTVKFSSLPAEIHNTFVKVLSSLPYGVLWKHEKPEMVDKVSGNILAKKWFPQSDILVESNVVLFISHCGLLGVYEALNGAKPILCLPIFYDQMTNAAFVEQLELGLKLDFRSVNENLFRTSLNAVLYNAKFQKNMVHFSNVFKDRQVSPADTFAYWIEYVVRYKGAPHLKPAGHELHFVQYLLLDVLAFVVATLIMTFSILRYILKESIQLCVRSKKQKRN